MPAHGDSATRLLALLRERPQQAHELAGSLGIDTSAARRHLESLRAQGLVDAAEHVDGPGRPKLRYALTLAGRETFRREYALVLSLVMRKLQDRHGRAAALTLLKDIAADLAGPIARAPDPRRALVKLYNDLGFEAKWNGTQLEQRNCIALRAATEDPEAFCEAFDEEIIRQALPASRTRLGKCMATGDGVCIHHVEPPHER